MTGVTTPGQNKPVSNGNEELDLNSQSSGK